MNSRPVSLIYVFLALVCFTGSISARTQNRPAAAETTAGSISGRVTVDGKPKAGLTVELLPPGINGPRRAIAKATTSKTGKYVLVKMPSGTYHVVPSGPTLVIPNEGTGGQPGKSVTIETGENVKGINFDLVSMGSISGRVRDVSGQAVRGQSVELILLGEGNYARPYYSPAHGDHSTNDEGVYHVSGAPPGRYRVKVGVAYGLATHGTRQKDDVFYAETFHPDAADATKAKVVEVSPGHETTDIDITVGTPLNIYDISGQLVLLETGAPVPNVALDVVTTGEKHSTHLSGAHRSDANGEFRIQGAMPGHYVVGPHNDPALNAYGDAVSFDVRDADVSGLKVPMHSASTLTGVVTIEGDVDVPVMDIFPKLAVYAHTMLDGSMPSSSQSNVTADGGFRIAGIRPGRVSLSAYLHRGGPGGVKLLRIERSGVAVRDGIEVRAGENVTGLRLVMGAGSGVLRGDVKIEGGLLEGVNLYVLFRSTSSDAGRYFHADLDTRQHFVIQGLVPGEYELMIGPMTTNISGERGGRTMNRMPTVKQTVVVGAGVEATVTLVMTLNPATPQP